MRNAAKEATTLTRIWRLIFQKVDHLKVNCQHKDTVCGCSGQHYVTIIDSRRIVFLDNASLVAAPPAGLRTRINWLARRQGSSMTNPANGMTRSAAFTLNLAMNSCCGYISGALERLERTHFGVCAGKYVDGVGEREL